MATDLCPALPQVAESFVSDGWDRFRDYAQSSFSLAYTLVEELQQFTVPTIAFSATFDANPEITGFNSPERPADPVFVFTEREIPAGPEISVPDIDIDDPPEFNENAPSLNLNGAPGDLTAQDPGDAPTVDDLVVPDAPDITIPDEPGFYGIVLPTPPVITLPTFDGVRPVFNDPAPPNTFNFTETPYSSALLTTVQERVTLMLGGGTGLPAAVEQALFDRAAGREDLNALRAIEEATQDWASRGWTEPQGGLVRRVNEIRQTAQNVRGQLNRDVYIQAQTVEIENLRFAVTQGIALESILIGAHMQIMQRAFDAARFAFEAVLRVFEAKITLFNAQMQAYRVDADVYRARIEAEIQKVQMYRAQVEAQGVIAQMNESIARTFAERVRAVLARVEIYRAQIAAVEALAQIAATRIEAFRARVQAYEARVRAYAAEWDGYRSRIEGQVARMRGFEIESSAFARMVEAYSSGNQAKVAQLQGRVSIGELLIRKHLAQLETLRTQIQQEIAKNQVAAQEFDGKARMYASAGQIELSRTEANNRAAQLVIESGRAQADVALRNGEIAINQNIENTRLILQGQQTAAQVAGQLTASSMSAVNLSASVSSGYSNSKSCGTSFSYSGEAPDA